MVDSLVEDIKRSFRSGNMLTRIILVNIAVFVVLNLVYFFDYHLNGGQSSVIYETLYSFLALPSGFIDLAKRFWTPIAHMFTHRGLWHLVWNMLILYWFGRVVGDFLGDRRLLPIYLLCGLAGGLFFFITDYFIPTGTSGAAYLIGASGAIMGLMMAAATTSPDYTFNLIFIGPVKIKYIAIVFFFLDIVATAGGGNEGGHFAHIGGALFGMFYVMQLRRGTDWGEGIARLIDRVQGISIEKTSFSTRPKPALKVTHKTEAPKQTVASASEDRLDTILEKIKVKGISSLTTEEREFLDQASKDS